MSRDDGVHVPRTRKAGRVNGDLPRDLEKRQDRRDRGWKDIHRPL